MKIITDKADWDKFHEDAGDKCVAIDFTASWCGPCKMIGPKFEAMESEFPTVAFAKVDVDENEEVAGEQNISAMPTFKFYRKGVEVDNLVGASEDKLRAMVAKYASA